MVKNQYELQAVYENQRNSKFPTVFEEMTDGQKEALRQRMPDWRFAKLNRAEIRVPTGFGNPYIPTLDSFGYSSPDEKHKIILKGNTAKDGINQSINAKRNNSQLIIRWIDDEFGGSLVFSTEAAEYAALEQEYNSENPGSLTKRDDIIKKVYDCWSYPTSSDIHYVSSWIEAMVMDLDIRKSFLMQESKHEMRPRLQVNEPQVVTNVNKPKKQHEKHRGIGVELKIETPQTPVALAAQHSNWIKKELETKVPAWKKHSEFAVFNLLEDLGVLVNHNIQKHETVTVYEMTNATKELADEVRKKAVFDPKGYYHYKQDLFKYLNITLEDVIKVNGTDICFPVILGSISGRIPSPKSNWIEIDGKRVRHNVKSKAQYIEMLEKAIVEGTVYISRPLEETEKELGIN